MRYIRDIPHGQFKIGLYAWNGKYIVKIEIGFYEQTYKVSELDVLSENEVVQLLDEPFLESVAGRFRAMHEDLMRSATRNEVM